MLRIAICDDDGYICDQLEDFIHIYEVTIMEKFNVETFVSEDELCQQLTENIFYDIIYLDIELKQLNGVEVGKIIREQMSNEITQIIYISSKENYAMQLFKTRPLDFIIKPLTYDKICETLDNALKIITANDIVFLYKKGQISYKVPIKEILYFESANRKVNIITIKGSDTFYGTLESIAEKLPYFINIHKSYLVNYNYVIKMEYHQLIMSNTVILPISTNNRKQVRNKLLELERCLQL
ncbi:MAG: LytTR family DNA-binding domain-containing protein [Herbinix sp.]|nr:LytTR family DNA-binding domain-containing protein [Herbinix sp.]